MQLDMKNRTVRRQTAKKTRLFYERPVPLEANLFPLRVMQFLFMLAKNSGSNFEKVLHTIHNMVHNT